MRAGVWAGTERTDLRRDILAALSVVSRPGYYWHSVVSIATDTARHDHDRFVPLNIDGTLPEPYLKATRALSEYDWPLRKNYGNLHRGPAKAAGLFPSQLTCSQSRTSPTGPKNLSVDGPSAHLNATSEGLQRFGPGVRSSCNGFHILASAPSRH